MCFNGIVTWKLVDKILDSKQESSVAADTGILHVKGSDLPVAVASVDFTLDGDTGELQGRGDGMGPVATADVESFASLLDAVRLPPSALGLVRRARLSRVVCLKPCPTASSVKHSELALA